MSAPTIGRRDVAKGAGLAALSRMGALIEVVSQPAYTWMFGVATYGVYTVLWAAVNIVENVIDLSMTQALQRIVPQSDNARAHAAVRFSLLVSVLPATVLALLATLFASDLAAFVQADVADRRTLPTAIALFAWALPLWTFVEVATSAARAKRAFGPEIRLRILWEQVARLIFAVILFFAGLHSLGLLVAHLMSLSVTALLSMRLLARYYDPKLLLTAPADGKLRHELLITGFALLPTAIARRLFIDLPPIILNLMLPGARGATAAGLFGIARKIGTIPLIVRQAFQYVLAPLASAQAAVDRAGIAPLYSFATRLSVAVVVPLSALLIFIGRDILSLFAPETMAALPLLVILVLGRGFETIVGPATPVIEMIGHRALPLINTIAGFAAWALFGWWLIPTMGASGMAIAVSVGTVLVAWLASLELRISDGLSVFDRGTWRALGAGLLSVILLAAVGFVPFAAPVRATLLLVAFFPALWLGLRVGLGREDRLALGKVGRRLRLVRA
jgi:O-antigen/teichoic acid export membrane protein